MSKTLVIPDIHNKIKKAESIITSKKYDEIVFLGDYFDDFGDGPKDVEKTAGWLKEALTLKNSHFLMGNHDMSYRFPKNLFCSCSGFSVSKSKAINKILSYNDWQKLELCYFTNNFLLSHAGVHEYVFGSYGTSITIKDIEAKCRQALEDCKANLGTVTVDAGMARGGMQPAGGITWLDWNDEFEAVEGINQIVGHTPHSKVQEKKTDKSINYGLDTHLNNIGWIEDGKFSSEPV